MLRATLGVSLFGDMLASKAKIFEQGGIRAGERTIRAVQIF